MGVNWESLRKKRESLAKQIAAEPTATPSFVKMSDRFTNPLFKQIALERETGTVPASTTDSTPSKTIHYVPNISSRSDPADYSNVNSEQAYQDNVFRDMDISARLSAINRIRTSGIDTYSGAQSEINRLEQVKSGAQRRDRDTSAYDKAIEMLKDYSSNSFGLDSGTSAENRQAIYADKQKEIASAKDEVAQTAKDRALLDWVAQYNNSSIITDEDNEYYIDVIKQQYGYDISDEVGGLNSNQRMEKAEELSKRLSVSLGVTEDYITDSTVVNDLQNRKNKIADLEQETKVYKRDYPNDFYSQYRNEPDFEELSKQREIKGETEKDGLYLEQSDKLGKYLSAYGSETEAMHGRGYNEPMTKITMPYMSEGWENSWQMITDSEKDMYYYLYNKQGQKAAYEYLDSLTNVLQKRAVDYEDQKVQGSEGLDRILRTASSVPDYMIGGATGYIDDISKQLQGKNITPYSLAHRLALSAESIRTRNAGEIESATGGWNIGGFTLGDLYQAGMSAADMFAGGYILGPVGYGAVMGMGSARAKAKELYDRGATAEQIFAESTAAGAFEMLFESVSLEIITNKIIAKLSTVEGGTKKTLAGIISGLLSAGTEGSEEVTTDVANYLADILIMKDKSERQLLIKDYLNQGYSQKEAEKLANEAFVQSLWKAFGGGFVAGGLGGGGMYAVSAAENAYNAVSDKVAERRATRNYVNEYADVISEAGGAESVMHSAADILKGNSTDTKALKRAVEKAQKAENTEGYDRAVALVAAEVEKAQQRELGGSYTQALKSAISDKITELAPTGTDVSAVTEVTDKVMNKGVAVLTRAERKVYTENREIIDSTVSALSSDEGRRGVLSHAIERAVATAKKITDTRVKAGVEKATGSEYDDLFTATDSGEDYVNDNPVNVQKFTDVSSKGMTVQLDDGTEVKAEDVSWGDSNSQPSEDLRCRNISGVCQYRVSGISAIQSAEQEYQGRYVLLGIAESI